MKLKRYVSEFELFIDRYKIDHPAVEEDQQRGWRIWWDRRQDLAEAARQNSDTVATKGYYYS